MAMRPEEIMAMLAQLGQSGSGNPMAGAIGKYAAGMPGGGAFSQGVPGPGVVRPQGFGSVPPQVTAGPMSEMPPVGGTPRPNPLPPSPAPDSGPYPGGASDEDMLNQVSDGMGGDDMQADADNLVQMYQSGDSTDPNTQSEWEAAKQAFISKYGAENLPELPNDPEPDSDTDDQSSGDDDQQPYQTAKEISTRDQQSYGAYEQFRKQNRYRNAL